MGHGEEDFADGICEVQYRVWNETAKYAVFFFSLLWVSIIDRLEKKNMVEKSALHNFILFTSCPVSL